MSGYFIKMPSEPHPDPFPNIADEKLWADFEARTEGMSGPELAKEMDAFCDKMAGIDEEGQSHGR